MIKSSFIIFIFLLIQGNCISQNYNEFSVSEFKLGSIELVKTTEKEFKDKKEFGKPDSISIEINVLGNEANQRNYHFKNSYFKCFDGFVRNFIIRDKGFILTVGKNSFKVGDNCSIIEKIFPKSYSNPIDRNTGFEKLHFDCDKTIYISYGVEVGGIRIFCKNGKIIGFYNYWMT